MINSNYWENIVSHWISVRSVEDARLTEEIVKAIVKDAIGKRGKKESLRDRLLKGFDEEEDYDY